MAPNSAKKWVSTSSGKLVVTSAGDTVLGKIPAAVPVNLVSIVGPARNGKSSLMNAIIGNGDTFKMSPAVKPCTEGGDLSPHTVRLSEIDIKNAGMDGAGQETAASTRSHLDPDDDPYVAFADVEGQGDESVEHDVRLATPFLLLSRVSVAIQVAEHFLAPACASVQTQSGFDSHRGLRCSLPETLFEGFVSCRSAFCRHLLRPFPQLSAAPARFRRPIERLSVETKCQPTGIYSGFGLDFSR